MHESSYIFNQPYIFIIQEIAIYTPVYGKKTYRVVLHLVSEQIFWKMML